MCGLAGIVRPRSGPQPDEQTLLRMACSIRHRGPDGFGIALDRGAGLVSTRLAIFDIPGGWQPIEIAESGSTLIYNGEVYNHPELREVSRLTLRDSFNCFRLALWDEKQRRLVSFREARAAAAA